METIYRGIAVSPGIAIAPALVFNVDRYDIPSFSVLNAAAEQVRFADAVAKTRDDLVKLHRKAAAELGETYAGIFKAHLMLLDDVALHEEVNTRIQQDGVNVEFILDDIAKRYTRVMAALNDLLFRERTADLLDVVDRVQRHLLVAERPNLKQLGRPSVIVSQDLSPSDTASLDLEHAAGLAVEAGSTTSHTAILARALEIPAVMGLKDLTQSTMPGVMVVVDGLDGLLVVDPSAETLARYRSDQQLLLHKRETLRRAVKLGPTRTQDGVEIMAQGNIELPVELMHSINSNAEGVGLYRTEYLFLNRDTLPSEEEQYEAYADVARAFFPYSVTLRTMDIGGDKLVGHLHNIKEVNPQLGWRAVRFCLERQDIFRRQLRAMLRASMHGNIQIMFPMISGLEELLQVKGVYSEVVSELKMQGVKFKSNVRIGSMIEIPSAVMVADALAEHCDFFSIGTNDLIQYALAVDRSNEKIAHLFQPAHPAVLRLIKQTCDAARRANIRCSICGEMAGDPVFTELFVGMGVSTLSMSSIYLPLIRAEVTHTTMPEATALAEEVLAFRTAWEVKDLLQARYEKKNALDSYLKHVSSIDDSKRAISG